jgi:hypothetical protein
MDSLIYGRSKTQIPIVRHHFHAISRLNQTQAAIIDDNDFKIPESLLLERVQALGEGFIRGQSRHHHRYRGVDLVGPRFSYHFRLCVAEPMQAMSGLPSPFKSATAQAAAEISPSSKVCRFQRAPSKE